MAVKDRLEIERERIETERREDVADERDLWVSALLCRLEEIPYHKAIDEADVILSAYRERFQ